MIVFILVAFVGISFLANQAAACMCMPTHPQNTFCHAHFAVKATIVPPELYEYVPPEDISSCESDIALELIPLKINILNVFKNHTDFINVTTMYVYTPATDGLCKLPLEYNVKYLLQGRLMGGLAVVDMCGGSRPWADLSMRQMKGVRYIYAKYCNYCSIKTSFSSFDAGEPNECIWQMKADPNNCYPRHAVCGTRETGGCKWNIPPEGLDICLNSVEENNDWDDYEELNELRSEI